MDNLVKVDMQWALANMDRAVDWVCALNRHEIELVFIHHVALLEMLPMGRVNNTLNVYCSACGLGGPRVTLKECEKYDICSQGCQKKTCKQYCSTR